MNIKLTLGERLKDLRVERNLKLEALAEQTGLSKSALSKYESDDVTDLSIYAVTTLAEFGHIVALILRQRRFGQTRLLCQRF